MVHTVQPSPAAAPLCNLLQLVHTVQPSPAGPHCATFSSRSTTRADLPAAACFISGPLQ
ncbi:hypothetical protein NDU88_007992, partial [Pleurodeles waltl]